MERNGRTDDDRMPHPTSPSSFFSPLDEPHCPFLTASPVHASGVDVVADYHSDDYWSTTTATATRSIDNDKNNHHIQRNLDIFTATPVTIGPWDDGHVPETALLLPPRAESGATLRTPHRQGDPTITKTRTTITSGTRLVQYPDYFPTTTTATRSDDNHNDATISRRRHRRPPTHAATVAVFDRAVDDAVVRALYSTTVAAPAPHHSWGTYVTMDAIRAYRRQQQQQQIPPPPCRTQLPTETPPLSPPPPATWLDDAATPSRDDLAVAVASTFLEQAATVRSRRRGDIPESPSPWTELHCCATSPSVPPPRDSGTIHPSTDTPIPWLWDADDNDADDDDVGSRNDALRPHELAPRVVTHRQDDPRRPHGVAVWALAADVGTSVPYHLDYAEQVRYDTNILVPPVLAGTLHCTNTEGVMIGGDDVEATATTTNNDKVSPSVFAGGDFCVNLDGIEHYRRHGYKGKLRPFAALSSSETNGDVFAADEWLSPTTAWRRIPYRYNRLICQSGPLPHYSTTVTSLPPGQKRVIVGFNVFLSDAGPLVQRTPEHSDAFRRKIALQRCFLSSISGTRRVPQSMPPHGMQSTVDGGGDGYGGSMTLQSVRQNPALAKVLVLAKRQRVKEELRLSQNKLDQLIQRLLVDRDRARSEPPYNASTETMTTTLSEIATMFGRTDGQFPNPTDVQVHVERRGREGLWQVSRSASHSLSENDQIFVSLPTMPDG